MSDILDRIFAAKAKVQRRDQERESFDTVRARALARRSERRPFAVALRNAQGPAIIGEIKRASPSAGLITRNFEPSAIAANYDRAGVDAISVLTEGRRFLGSLGDLEAVRDAVDVPVLRKDFIADPYQVFEARAAGADLVLLIVAALEQPRLVELHELIRQLGMTALVETHSAEEVERALDLGASVVGVNARDLNTFELDRELFGALAGSIPSGVVRIAESAVKEPADVAHYRAAGADVVLVGEALVTGGDPVATLQSFLGKVSA